jgi:serine phosphatase RsbU (regulator of sigma subunit)
LICICDAVGHGVSAALFAARINTYVLTHARADLIPCELVAGLNAYLCKRLAGTGMYATFYALLLDFKSGTMNLSGAAHPPVLQLEKDHNRCREWPSATTFLGIEDPMPLLCGSECLRLNTGDHFLLYSDGLIEVEDAEAQAFGTEKLSSTLIAHRNLSGQVLNKAILMQVESYADDGFKDDVLLMSITLK